MKKWIGYAVIILPILYVAYKWHVWDGGIGGLILAEIAVLNCTIWTDHCDKPKRNSHEQEN